MHRIVRGMLALLIFASIAAPLAAPTPVGADYGVPNGYFFTQTGGGDGKGFTIADDSASSFWSEFNRLGGVQAVGYPISTRYISDGFVVQAMQRVIFQWRPEVGQVYTINVFDDLSRAGKDDWLLAVRQTPRPLGPDFDAGLSWEDAMAKRLALLDDNPAIRDAYYGVVGDPILMNGLPTSPVADMGNHYALRAQRVVFQQWTEDVPWAVAGQVTMALGGSIAAEAGLIPSNVLQAESAPGAAPLVRPADPAVQLPSMPAGGFGHGFQVDQAADLDRALGMTSEAGFGWVKFQVPWKDIEPQPGQINWTSFDAAVARASGRGLRILFSVTAAPMWARPGGSDLHENGPPTSPEPFARFLGAMADRYRGKVTAYDVWNEQNLSREWGGPGRQNAAEYVAMLQAAHRSIKAADPQALVITGALTPAGNVDLGQGYLAIDDSGLPASDVPGRRRGLLRRGGRSPQRVQQCPGARSPEPGRALSRRRLPRAPQLLLPQLRVLPGDHGGERGRR